MTAAHYDSTDPGDESRQPVVRPVPRKSIARGFVELHETIDGDLEVTGGQVVLHGVVNGSVIVRGGRATLHGVVTGDVINDGGHVVIVGDVGGRITGSREYTIVDLAKRGRLARKRSEPTVRASEQHAGIFPDPTVQAVAPVMTVPRRRRGFVPAAVAASALMAGALVIGAGVWLSAQSGSRDTEVAGVVIGRSADPAWVESVAPPVVADSEAAENEKVEAAVDAIRTDVFDPPAPTTAGRFVLDLGFPLVATTGGLIPACHPSYSPCIPLAVAVECPIDADASGADLFQVVGDDVLELDADGNGVACDEP